MQTPFYQYTMPGGAHWSLRLKRGTLLRIKDIEGGANLGMMLYNPDDLSERYNAPDTLKCQHTFKLSRGHCLYSDMGRIFCSIVADSFGWHDTVCGVSNKQQVNQRWGALGYQQARNEWHLNGFDSFLVELAKYGLNRRDMASNLNWFSAVIVDDEGNLQLDTNKQQAGAEIELRFEMDTLVVMHTCPHPLSLAATYPRHPISIEMLTADPVTEDDYCLNFRPENKRGFTNNKLYLGFQD